MTSSSSVAGTTVSSRRRISRERGCRAWSSSAAPPVGGAAVSERVFAGFDVRISRYAYLVSLLPRRIVDELGLRRAARAAGRVVVHARPARRRRARAARRRARPGGDAGARSSGSATATSTLGTAFRPRCGRSRSASSRRCSSRCARAPSCAASSADDAAWEALVETPLGALARRMRSPTISCAASCSPTRSSGRSPPPTTPSCARTAASSTTSSAAGPATGTCRSAAWARCRRRCCTPRSTAGAHVRTSVEVTAVGDGEVRFQTATGGEESVGARFDARERRARRARPPARSRGRTTHLRRIAAQGQPPARAPAAPARPARPRRHARSRARSTSTRPPSSSAPRTRTRRPGGFPRRHRARPTATR